MNIACQSGTDFIAMFSCYQLGFSAWQHGPGNCNIANTALNRIQTKPEGLCRFLVKNKFLSIALHLKLVHRSLGSCWDLNCYTWKCCCCRHFGMMAFGWAALAPGQNIFNLSNDAMGRFHWGRGRSLPAMSRGGATVWSWKAPLLVRWKWWDGKSTWNLMVVKHQMELLTILKAKKCFWQLDCAKPASFPDWSLVIQLPGPYSWLRVVWEPSILDSQCQ